MDHTLEPYALRNVCSFLGYGDVALPGLLAAFARLSDLSLQRASLWSGYFLPAVCSYAAGLAMTYCALLYSLFGDNGQPALLYLVCASFLPTPPHLLCCCVYQVVVTH